MLSVGKSDAIVQVLPAALRFWEKLGLKPRGGGKDVTAFVLFEGSNEARIDQIYSWLQSLSQTYEVGRAPAYHSSKTECSPGEEPWKAYSWTCSWLC